MKHIKLVEHLIYIPSSSNNEITQILSEICIQKNIKTIPRLVELEIKTGPFITGFLNPVIVLPFNISSHEAKYILLHELEHFACKHLFIKAWIEIITIIYWWNPIIWILRKEIICALEIQADTNVIKNLLKECHPNLSPDLSYIETLIKISKDIYKRKKNPLFLSFSMGNSLIHRRVHSALKLCRSQQNRNNIIVHTLLILFSVIVLLCSFIFTFEAYNISPENVQGTFTTNPKTDYFIMRDDRIYDLYIKGTYMVTLNSIPDELSQLPIQK